jgi:hypothetical protein
MEDPTPQAVKPRELFIQGMTLDGKVFRPSDWAERLAGALSSYRPGLKGLGISAHIGYSPYCVPQVVDSVKCVVVDERLRDIEPMAWDFVMSFARDNQLCVVEACWLPEPSPASRATTDPDGVAAQPAPGSQAAPTPPKKSVWVTAT